MKKQYCGAYSVAATLEWDLQENSTRDPCYISILQGGLSGLKMINSIYFHFLSYLYFYFLFYFYYFERGVED